MVRISNLGSVMVIVLVDWEIGEMLVHILNQLCLQWVLEVFAQTEHIALDRRLLLKVKVVAVVLLMDYLYHNNLVM